MQKSMSSSLKRAATMQGSNAIPPHVQGILNQEERKLQQTLDHLNREAAYKIRTITQQQQVLQRSMQVLQTKLKVSQLKSQAVLNPPSKTSEDNTKEKSRNKPESKPPHREHEQQQQSKRSIINKNNKVALISSQNKTLK